jgi:hypothetical protein
MTLRIRLVMVRLSVNQKGPFLLSLSRNAILSSSTFWDSHTYKRIFPQLSIFTKKSLF